MVSFEKNTPPPVDQSNQMPGMVNRALRMMLGTLASRVLGLLREVLTAVFFGATRTLDTFYVAYTLANLSRQLLAEGALSASFVPVFSRVLKKNGEQASKQLAQSVLSILLAACALVVLIGVLFSPVLVKIIAPGFDYEQRLAAVTFTRSLFPFLIIVSVGALAMGVLNSIGSFFVPAIAPAVSNLAFIAILLTFRQRISIWTLVTAVLAGGVCSMILQCAWAGRMGYPILPLRPDLRNPDLRETLKLFLPYAAGLSLNQINPVISRMLGSFLGDGVISVLNYADRIIQLPLGLFVIAISQAVLPMLSRLDSTDKNGFNIFLRDALRFNLFVVLPAALALILTARPIVHILLVRGAFNEWAWEATSGALACYAAGLPGIACNTVLMRALYARSLPKEAVGVTIFTVCANLILGAVLMQWFSHKGLALGTSCAFTGAAFLAAWLLARDLGVRIRLFESVWLLRLMISCSVMAVALIVIMRYHPYPVNSGFAWRLFWMTLVVVFGGLLYASVSTVLRCPEWTWIRHSFDKGKK